MESVEKKNLVERIGDVTISVKARPQYDYHWSNLWSTPSQCLLSFYSLPENMQRKCALISRESYYGRAHFKLETFCSYAITTVHIDHTTCAIIYATAKSRYFLCLLILRR